MSWYSTTSVGAKERVAARRERQPAERVGRRRGGDLLLEARDDDRGRPGKLGRERGAGAGERRRERAECGLGEEAEQQVDGRAGGHGGERVEAARERDRHERAPRAEERRVAADRLGVAVVGRRVRERRAAGLLDRLARGAGAARRALRNGAQDSGGEGASRSAGTSASGSPASASPVGSYLRVGVREARDKAIAPLCATGTARWRAQARPTPGGCRARARRRVRRRAAAEAR